ncbi:MAG: sulfotransferase domain-containing protein [Sedimentisphaerales bacterium]|nr:sulfotransferase domain-containing protein [Sedimentisphaerales bacterium]
MSDFLTIVSGLPRSGTSMMMQAIAAGGMEALADHVRRADEDNPRGYYEYEPVKKTKEDPSWLALAQGRVVKMVYRLLYDLPLEGYAYRVVFMRRAMAEVLASQKKMLHRLGKEGGNLSDEQMALLFQKQLDQFDRWIGEQSCFQILYINYADMVSDPANQCRRVNAFLGGGLDENLMVASVDPNLYRNRG